MSTTFKVPLRNLFTFLRNHLATEEDAASGPTVAQQVAWAQGAGRLQHEILILSAFAMFPYIAVGLGTGIDPRVVYSMFGMLAVLYSYSAGVRRLCRIHRIDRMVPGSEPDVSGIRFRLYLNLVAFGDLFWLAFLIVGTGGVVASSFVPFLLMVPTLAMVYEAAAIRSILWLTTLVFALLSGAAILGFSSWPFGFQANKMESAYGLSMGIATVASVWILHFQYWIRPRRDAKRKALEGA